MSYRNIRPLHILWQKNLDIAMLEGVTSGIRSVLSLAGVGEEVRLRYLAQRRQSEWINKDGTFIEYRSLDWHIEHARQKSNELGYLNSTALLNSLWYNEFCPADARYDLVVLNEPLHWHENSQRKVAGIGRPNQGSVITIGKYVNLLQPTRRETSWQKEKRQFNFFLATRILTMHELGHVFGLFPGTDKEDPTDDELKESHCPNQCAMYWRLDIKLIKKIAGQPFCQSCLEELKKFFITP